MRIFKKHREIMIETEHKFPPETKTDEIVNFINYGKVPSDVKVEESTNEKRRDVNTTTAVSEQRGAGSADGQENRQSNPSPSGQESSKE